MFDESGPDEGWFLNGEPATPDELRLMEAKALQLLAPMPAEYHRQYNYETAEAIVGVSTSVSEEESHLGSVAEMLVGYKESGSVLLEIVYGYDNQPIRLYYDEDELGAVSGIVQELLDGGLISGDTDRRLLKHLQDTVFCLQLGIEHNREEAAGAGTGYVADLIRQQVEARTNHVVRSQHWSLAFEDSSVLTALQNQVIGEAPISEDDAFPVFQIQYNSQPENVAYVYTRDSDGDVALETTNGMAWGGFDDELMSDEDFEVAEFIEGLGSDVPGRAAVALITSRLCEAAILDAVADQPAGNN